LAAQEKRKELVNQARTGKSSLEASLNTSAMCKTIVSGSDRQARRLAKIFYRTLTRQESSQSQPITADHPPQSLGTRFLSAISKGDPSEVSRCLLEGADVNQLIRERNRISWSQEFEQVFFEGASAHSGWSTSLERVFRLAGNES